MLLVQSDMLVVQQKLVILISSICITSSSRRSLMSSISTHINVFRSELGSFSNERSCRRRSLLVIMVTQPINSLWLQWSASTHNPLLCQRHRERVFMVVEATEQLLRVFLSCFELANRCWCRQFDECCLYVLLLLLLFACECCYGNFQTCLLLYTHLNYFNVLEMFTDVVWLI